MAFIRRQKSLWNLQKSLMMSSRGQAKDTFACLVHKTQGFRAVNYHWPWDSRVWVFSHALTPYFRFLAANVSITELFWALTQTNKQNVNRNCQLNFQTFQSTSFFFLFFLLADWLRERDLKPKVVGSRFDMTRKVSVWSQSNVWVSLPIRDNWLLCICLRRFISNYCSSSPPWL